LYTVFLSVPVAGGFQVQDRRGWSSADLTVNGRMFRFVDTHLDPTVPAIAAAQAFELLQGPLVSSVPVVLVGDLNSGPEDAAPGAYSELVRAGLTDAWLQANGATPGPTCCNAENLLNPVPALTTRIDHILTRPQVSVGRVARTRIDQDNRMPTGLWPSDHAASWLC
jgi:endonuclease/exonuclease/phosphatase family metal-dependent hydrolase